MNQPFIFLAKSKVHYVSPAGDTYPLESRYAADLTAKALKAQERHAWKGREGSNFLSAQMLWGKENETALAIHFTSVARGRTPDEFLYTLRTDHLCAICAVRGEAAEETRLWNHQSTRLNQLNTHPALGHIVCSSEKPNGAAHLAVRLAEDGVLSDLTEGDSFDTAPSWIPGDKLRVVYQSAGVARNQEGQYSGLGPFGIHQIDVESGELTTLAEDPNRDLLTPRVTADGTLYYIRRPYERFQSASFLDHLKDFFLFPFRLGRAVLGFLNFFSMMYSGKQLKTVKTADAKQMPMPQMILWGNLLKAQQPDQQGEGSSLVPASWELIQKVPNGVEKIIADSTLCFDVARDGSLLYSNGSQITIRHSNGSVEVIARNEFVQQVAFLNS